MTEVKEISLKSILRTAIQRLESGREDTEEQTEFAVTVNDERFEFRAYCTWRIHREDMGDVGEKYIVESAELESIDELILLSEWGEIDLTDFIDHV